MSSKDIAAIQARSLWIGEIEGWMDEGYIESKLLNYNVTPKSIKVIRDRSKGVSLGYGFIEFFSVEQASQVLNTLNGKGFLDKSRTFKLNWAKDSASKAASMGSLPKNEFTIYVGELEGNVTEELLKEIFQKNYTSILGTKVVIDPINKKSKGYGFVRFSDYSESQMAIGEMNGKLINGKVIKVSQASFKKLTEIGANVNGNSSSIGEKPSSMNNMMYKSNNQSVSSQQDNCVNGMIAKEHYSSKARPHDKAYHNNNYVQANNELKQNYKGKGANGIHSTVPTPLKQYSMYQYQHELNHQMTEVAQKSSSPYQPQTQNPYLSFNNHFHQKGNVNYIMKPRQEKIEKEVNHLEKQVIDSLNDFYKANKRRPNEESQTIKDKESTHNLHDFYFNNQNYPLMNLVNYYFPNTSLYGNTKPE